MIVKNDVQQSMNIRDEFHFSEVHGSMNATAHVQSKCRPKDREASKMKIMKLRKWQIEGHSLNIWLTVTRSTQNKVAFSNIFFF